MRSATPTFSAPPTVVGNPDAAFAGAAKVVEADYDVPFQGHTAFGPAHAMADPSNDQLTIYSNDMKSYGLRNGVARVPRRCRAIACASSGWKARRPTAARRPTMPGSRRRFWRRSSAGRCACSGSRQEETAWDTKGPAYAVKMRGGLDAQGNLVALDYDARAADHNHLGYNELDTVLDRAADRHAARDAGARRRRRRRRRCTPFPNRRMTHARRRRCRWCGRRRCAPATCAIRTVRRSTFASESFIDELAAAAKADPVEFRLKLLTASTDRRQRLQARALDRRASRRRPRRTAGTRVRRRSRAAPATSSPAAASPTPIRSQTVVGADRRGRGEPPHRPRLGEAARLRARLRPGRSIPRRCAARSRAACCTR